jgi:hypothetical protein
VGAAEIDRVISRSAPGSIDGSVQPVAVQVTPSGALVVSTRPPVNARSSVVPSADAVPPSLCTVNETRPEPPDTGGSTRTCGLSCRSAGAGLTIVSDVPSAAVSSTGRWWASVTCSTEPSSPSG